MAQPDPACWPGSESPVERLRLRRAPLLAASLAFGAGDCLAQEALAYQPAALLSFFALLLAAAAILLNRRSSSTRLLPIAALWIVTGFWCAEMQPAPPSQAAAIAHADGLSRIVQGHITRVRRLPPRTSSLTAQTLLQGEEPELPSALSFDLAVDAIEEVNPDTSRLVPVNGGIRVTVTGDASGASPRCGDRVELPMQLRTPERYRDPGAWQYADFLAVQGIGVRANIPSSRLAGMDRIVESRTDGWSPFRSALRCRLYQAQTWAGGRMLVFAKSRPNRLLSTPFALATADAGMLNAMLFGDRDRLNHNLRLGFERTGSFHLFVVSGMHVALLAGGLFWITRFAGLSRLAATLITLAMTTLYALLTGFGAPVQRALLMSAIFLLAQLLCRERNVLNGFGAAVLGMLLLSPSSLFEPGFQMTFLAVVAIAGIAIPLGEWSFLRYARASRNLDDLWLDAAMHPRQAQFRIMLRILGEHLQPLLHPLPGRIARNLPATIVRWSLWAAELVLIGIVAEMVMVLPMALYFHRATIFALPANMISIPMVGLLAPVATLTFLLSLLSPWLAALPGAVTALLLHGITGAIGRVSHFQSADWRIPGPPLGAVAAACIGWAFCIWAVRYSRRTSWLAAAVLPGIAVLVLWPRLPVITHAALEVTAIDVGQGDSLLVVSPEGLTMLVDAGGPVGRAGNVSSTEQLDAFDVGEDVVSPYLWSRRFHRLDVVALTHAHSDHMGGMAAVLRNFHPRELWVGIDPQSAAYAALLQQARDLGVTVRHLHAGDTLPWGGMQVETLSPSAGYRNSGAPANDDSLVMRLVYGNASAQLEGDAEAATERAMLANGSVHPVTLLKVGHHGSRTSTTPEFFAAAAPREAVISVGRNNTFGHPRLEVITRIAAAHTRLYRTDEFGLAQFILTRDGQIREIGVEPAEVHGEHLTSR